MSYPQQLIYGIKQSQYNAKQNTRVEPQTSKSASANQVVRFQLPQNTLVDLKSFKRHFQASTSGGEANEFVRLPNYTSSFIIRYEVSV